MEVNEQKQMKLVLNPYNHIHEYWVHNNINEFLNRWFFSFLLNQRIDIDKQIPTGVFNKKN